MPDNRRAARPCEGGTRGLRTRYKLGNELGRKRTRTVAPIVAAFKEARLASGMSQVIAAERAGYDPETLSRFERGMTSVSVATFSNLCAVVGLVLVVLPEAGLRLGIRVSREGIGKGSKAQAGEVGESPMAGLEQAP